MSSSEPMPRAEEGASDANAPQSEASLRKKSIEILTSCGISPHFAVLFLEAMIEMQLYFFTGASFAVLSYFFFDGTYLEMLGIYLVHHIKIVDCILYELMVILPADVPSFEIFVRMQVSFAFLLITAVYILIAVVLEVTGFILCQLVLIFKYMATHDHKFMMWIGLGRLPWYLYRPMGMWYTCRGFVTSMRNVLGLIRWVFSFFPEDMAICAAKNALIYIPKAWKALSGWVQGTKELLLKIHEVLTSPLSFRRHKDLLYSYTPLHTGDEIGLLLLRGSFWGPELHGKLVHANTHKLPQYECISHRWSDSTETKTMVLNGRSLKISTSVYNILRHRRATFATRLIWIDSVCINQDDSMEKSHQVRKMQTIYAKATRVTVCLGDSPDAHLARGLIQTLFSHITLFDRKEWSQVILELYIRSQEQNDGAPPPEWMALRKLLRHTWFERCWVIQEVVLASKVYILYGGKYIDWEILLRIIIAFIQERSGPIRKLMSGKDGTGSTPASLTHVPLMEGYRFGYLEKLPLKFHALLRSSLTFRATDPRDKMFALQGISEAASSLPIDYDLDIEQVLLSTSSYLLKRPEAIEVLQHAGIGWTEESDYFKRPSWVVDWSRTRQIGLGSLSSSKLGDFYLYRAAVEIQPHIREVENNCIEIAGLRVDRIEILGRVRQIPPENHLYDLQEENDKTLLWLREAESMARRLPSEYSYTDQPRSEAFWRTCIGDRHMVTRPAEADYGEKYLEFKEATIRKHALDHMSSVLGPTPLSENENLLPEEGEFLERRYKADKPAEQYLEHLQRGFVFSAAFGSCCNGRCFALSEKGYMVVAPPGTKEGDMICVFMGAQVPFLLRPISKIHVGEASEEKCYALVGECYVHGLMDGEGLKQGFDEQNFLIC